MKISQHWRQQISLVFYNALLCLGLPFFFFKLLRHSTQRGRQWREYRGFVPTFKQPTLWIHAASVGEVRAAMPLVRALQVQYPQLTLLMTTTTLTGAEQVAQNLPQIRHGFAPLDCAIWVRRFVKRIQPVAVLMIESERWINYMQVCEQYQIPVAVINARISPRSMRQYQRLPSWLVLWARPITVLCVQSSADDERFAQLGIAKAKRTLTGSIKFDMNVPSGVLEAGKALRTQWQQAGKQQVWIAASTHLGEEALILEAFQQLLTVFPHALLVLVPRHPQRFAPVAALCHAQGLQTVLRSSGQVVQTTTHLYLGDTMGELMLLYAAADVAFVGGSLVPIGGHNMLEPAALAKPCVMGRYGFNFPEITRQLQQDGALQVVNDATELAVAIRHLWQDPRAAQAMGQAGLRVVEQNRGAVAHTLQALRRVIPVQ